MSLKINSLCVKEPDDPRTTKPHQLPIYATSSFEFDSVEDGIRIFRDPSKAHIYGRFANPTVDAVAQKLAILEAYGCGVKDAFGIMTSSGMSAIATILYTLLRQNDKLLTQGNLYGGTTEFIGKVVKRAGIDIVNVNLQDHQAVEAALEADRAIRVIFFETPSNPALDCIDIEAIVRIAKKFDVLTVIDNTFCTPLIQQPLRYGVDYVVHSTTKYLNGHGNSLAGVVIGFGKERQKEVWTTMKLMGTNTNAFDAWLTNNGLKTLALRMERHSQNGLDLARFLESHDKVQKVRYLGLPNHERHELAKRQMKGYTGMLCFEVAGGYDEGLRCMNALTIGSLAPTLGDVDTLIMHPASMSHLNVDRQVRLANGITDSLIRVSVGIEDIDDLIEDFDRALKAV